MHVRPVFQYSYADGVQVHSYKSIKEAAAVLGVDESTIRKALDTSRTPGGYLWSSEDLEFHPLRFAGVSPTEADYMITTHKKLQRERDITRIERSQFRNNARVDNATEALLEALVQNFKSVQWTLPDGVVPERTLAFDGSAPDTLIVQLSDLHLNELIDIQQNQFNITIASQRLQKYAHYVKQYCRVNGVRRVVVAITGDVLNSDRRLDETLHKATNRAIASFVATKLIAQFIMDVRSVAIVDIVSVMGNESRMTQEFGVSTFTATDNYDYIIHNQLKLLLEKVDGIHFLEGDPMEVVLSINGLHILLLHGTTLKKDSQMYMQQVLGKYSAMDILIDYILFGHIHFATITDKFARSASLSGANAYSDRVLQLSTHASQNMHFIAGDGTMVNMRVDLQNASNFAGYPIEDFPHMYEMQGYESMKFAGKRRFAVIELMQ